MTDAAPSRLAAWTKHLDRAGYALVAAVLTLAVATRFYASLRLQTLHALHWASPSHFDELALRAAGPWSAPLDDVFIHFDFARSIARGYPFEWSPGNGYSSGGTSLLYPFVLAAGYLAGFRELRLMEWAAVVACVCTFATLLAARRLAAGLAGPLALLLPFGFLSVGVLGWSLFSGMEVALFLALWGAAYYFYDVSREAWPNLRERQRWLASALVGLLSGLLTATRPEGITAVGVLILAMAYEVLRQGELRPLRPNLRRAARAIVPLVLLAGIPSVAVLVAHSVANLVFTGETAAAGALVKLEAHHPYLSRAEVWEAWWFHVRYQVLRVTHYHFADQPAYGWLVWSFAAVALAFRRTRRSALILWASALLWILVVATNGQVRWQNERYTMPAVAWLLLAASLGVGVLLQRAYELRSKLRGPALGLATLALVGLFLAHQEPRFRDQVWFFGRAARNILDQHVTVGTRLRFEVEPVPQRVLVGDAGAIPYVSDLPALDIIGLGGFKELPFARATRHHVGAAIELIERMPASDRPDLLALYPGWWGDFPLWFGRKLGEVPVRGNVICGGASKVLYRPDWQALDESALPFTLGRREFLVDSLDHADLVNEREHSYRIEGAVGYVTMKLIGSPSTGKPLFDAGRLIPPGAREKFHFGGFDPNRPARLVIRAAPTEYVVVPVRINGEPVGAVRLEPKSGWVEGSLPNLRLSGSRVEVTLDSTDRERILHHVFLVQGR